MSVKCGFVVSKWGWMYDAYCHVGRAYCEFAGDYRQFGCKCQMMQVDTHADCLVGSTDATTRRCQLKLCVCQHSDQYARQVSARTASKLFVGKSSLGSLFKSWTTTCVSCLLALSSSMFIPGNENLKKGG